MSKAINPPPDQLSSDHRCSMGIEGLDSILAGGIPSQGTYLVQGDPGAGKTTLAIQFLLEGVRRGERVFYVTLSETKAELDQVAASHGWSLEKIQLLEMSAVEAIIRPESRTTVFHPSEVELNKVSELLVQEFRKASPVRMVFDSLSEFRLMAETALRYRRQLLSLKHEFSRYKCTVLLLDDRMEGGSVRGDPHVLSLSHGVIDLEQVPPEYGITRRRIRVSKLRGVKFREGYHDYVIKTGGLEVFPRLVAAEHHTPFERRQVSSGIREMDELFGGGLDCGTTTLILGPAGTGKSTVALQYTVQMASAGTQCAYFTFDETLGILFARAGGLGLPLLRLVEEGKVAAQQVDPAEISPGEFIYRIHKSVRNGCKLIVIDSLNGYMNAMPGEKYLVNQLHELCSFLNQQGVVTILTMAQHGLVMGNESPLDISYLADMVVALRFFESHGEVRNAIAAIKKRSGPHEKTIREFRLETGKGISIGKPLRDFQGVLTPFPAISTSGTLADDRHAGFEEH